MTIERIRKMDERCKKIDDKIDGWNPLTEDEDRTFWEEKQALHILGQMIHHEPPLLTDAGMDYVDECLARSEEWIDERLEGQGND